VLPDLIEAPARQQARRAPDAAGRPLQAAGERTHADGPVCHVAAAAAAKARKEGDQELAEAIATMILRDCRKYAADLAATAQDAQQLLQHGSKVTTMRHYRSRPDKAKPVR
jgi:hypothetical protein